MLKYLAKISMDIFPSVLATIIGAYIVNHYINARPAADTPAVAVAPAHPKKDGKPASATDVANLPAPGIKAKGISEKAVSEKASVDKPAEARAADTKAAESKAAEAKASEPKSSEPKPSESKAADAKPSEEAAAPVNPRAHQPSPREKAVAKVTPAVVAPVEASTAPAGNAAPGPDANDLARAAIERLRKTPEGAAQESARAADAPRVQEAPRIVTATPAAVRPLPPPITVSSPASEAYSTQQLSSPSYTASVGGDDANRPTPPADIPVPIVTAPPPLDLRADAAGPMPRAKSNVTNVADDMLSAAKSMFHAVLPKAVTPD